MSTPAGWYPQPDGQQRYWDGGQWTGDLAPGAEVAGTTPSGGGGPAGPTVKKKHIIGYSATALVCLVFGAALASSASTLTDVSGAANSSQVPTITIATPGPTSTTMVPGPTVTKTSTQTVTSTVTNKPPAKTVTVTAAPAAPKASGSIPGDGTFQVGVDIQPGTYVSAPPSLNCYWARLSSPNTNDIIDNNNSSGQSVVTIRSSDKFFETSGCSEWIRR